MLKKFLEKFKTKKFNWADARYLLSFENDDWDSFFNEIGSYRFETLQEAKALKFYTPGKSFPSISVTGNSCDLNCKHCDRKYLSNMLQAETEEKFKNALNYCIDHNSVGALISGGCTSYGKVPIEKYKDIILDFKRKNKKFFLNSHVGLISYSEARSLKESGIDTVSFDLNLDSKVIQDVFNLDFKIEDYIESYDALLEAGLRVIPHVLIGARFGKIARELDAIKVLSENPPELLVFIGMIPPRTNGEMDQNFELLTPESMAKFFLISKVFLPSTLLSLGCMRPKGKFSFDLERWSILSGANHIVMPTAKTIKWAKQENFKIEYYSACCVIPSEFEPYAQAIDSRGALKYPDLLSRKHF
ncbi:radical SAM protein [Promethearchaeum syntrophicum]|uniref:Radical SAM protein n=1 Tax=Promethearchaeum syntrophicum TaxID=2594042 RepID=A0A5B9DAI1_9ARCH